MNPQPTTLPAALEAIRELESVLAGTIRVATRHAELYEAKLFGLRTELDLARAGQDRPAAPPAAPPTL